VALVKGAALGGGMEVLLACDLVLATPRASFGQPEIKVGVYPPPASILLPPMIGTRRANELILTGRTLRAPEAKEYGIVNHVFPDDEFDAKAEEIISGFLALSGTVLRRTVEVLRFGERYLEVMKPVSEHYHERLMTTADAQEGLAAFLEKRAPRWQHGL
jgi:cyclohexa-1,5-dienecarbonyl-CoA hydratase